MVSEVCSILRKRCSGDDLWKEHIRRRWGPVVGDVVYKEWKWHITSAKEENSFRIHQNNGSVGTFSGDWPRLSLGSYLEDSEKLRGSLSNYFMKALYLSVENGKFWFPAQIYKGNGVSCYDALLSYESETDSFQARIQRRGWHVLKKNIRWDEVRATPVETPPNALHVSDDLSNLKPGDHIEIQFRTARRTSYEWWYATIGHLETCDEHENNCGCDQSEVVVVEFKQYPPTSRMKRLVLSKDNGREHDDGRGRLYGGIRKIHSQPQIDTWKRLFPRHYLHPPSTSFCRVSLSCRRN
ncbi:F-box protein At2g32560-like [Neltuma alba]|uniref:F-box protein At2g32560-like n=1 Tax=Neltuma alba TaxID=207710 RepID=UPI0010A30A13|nr:F-box protein At2g32560-like [Prosopis alba]